MNQSIGLMKNTKCKDAQRKKPAISKAIHFMASFVEGEAKKQHANISSRIDIPAVNFTKKQIPRKTPVPTKYLPFDGPKRPFKKQVVAKRTDRAVHEL